MEEKLVVENINKAPKEFILNRKRLLVALEDTIVYENVQIMNGFLQDIKSNKRNDFLSIDENLVLSYAKDNKTPFNPPKRINTTLGRYIRRNLKIGVDKICDGTLDRFCKTFLVNATSSKTIEKDIEFLSGKNIQKFYKNTTIKSCMTGDGSYETELYALNPKNIKLLVYKKNVARALFWKLDDNKFYLDRIYPSDGGAHIKLLLSWAKQKGYKVYDHDNEDGSCNCSDCREGRKNNKNMFVTAICKSSLPYFDTFQDVKFLTKKSILLSDWRFEGSSYMEEVKTPWEPPICFSCEEKLYPGTSGKIYAVTSFKKADKKPLCENCAAEFIIACSSCRKKFYYNHYDYQQFCCDDDVFCFECIKNKKIVASCANCNEFNKISKMKTYQDKNRRKFFFCKNCFGEGQSDFISDNELVLVKKKKLPSKK